MISRPVAVGPHLHRMLADPPSSRPAEVARGDVDAESVAAGVHDRALWSLASHASPAVRAAADERARVLTCRR